MTMNKWIWLAALGVLSQAAGPSAKADPGGPERYAMLDTNGDGTVTTAEFVAGALQRWVKSDTNGDGKVTAEEFAAQFAAHAQERFRRLDGNGNGVIERSEAARMPDAKFNQLDADGSGTLSEAEFAHGPPPPPVTGADGGFRGLPGDTDNDGAISQAEATVEAQQRAARLDADGDGKLTQQELARAHGPHHGAPPNAN